ncbi:metallophosphoesterase [Clostridium estertheticum]|uniref:metallophosphoesterase family protein n=1 Tax=Clostridium estertheticum TaxID=238834 RepID=UPI001C0E2629|nr:metallophosphoesterase [Clostridium estertheticum]MBU3215097.1 metallophosphoesterase [Clostridium estertheticum]WAG55616.1 metallophosphoesterase [Clostridium estertheticum]
MVEDVMLNGPYLLSPTTNSMTVVWETRTRIKTNVFYGIYGQLDQSIEVCIHKETSCKDNADGNFICMAIINNLDSNTQYSYMIQLESGEKVRGNFKTLNDNPDKIKIFTISDSHLFYTNKQFSNIVMRNKPDFIIHVGDIPFGTGYQREQYENNWFKKIPEVLKTIPFIYIPGNHDDGPFYNDFFTFPQSKIYHCDETGRTFSFDYGKTHFLMIDSNSWGLFEMNAVNSGLLVDVKTKKLIKDTLDWVIDDLKLEQSQSAEWRVMVLHHPYTDEFNNKYIVPIAEKYNVNFVLSGHLHYYIKNISINPKIGAKTVYITQGSAQDGENELNLGESDKRLLAEFPEVIATGKGDYGCINIVKDRFDYQSFGFENDNPQEILVDTVILTNEEPKIIISNVQITTLDNFGHIQITGKTRNVGSGIAAVTVRVNDNEIEHVINLFGNKGEERVIALNCNEEIFFVAIYEAKIPGQHGLRVTNVTKNIIVSEPKQLTFEYMKLKVDNDKNTNLLSASVEITNNLKNDLHVPVEFFIDENIIETKMVSLRGYEKKLIQYYHKFLRGGNYRVKIANLEEKEIKIQSTLRIIPRVKDLSGNGNDALLHGTPRVVKEADRVVVKLDQYSDYLEIPDSDSLHVNEGFTGVVWANISRLAKNTEMGHNPLMAKGKSIGWGATYLLRMVVERAGSLKWGTCYDGTEYHWQGGNISLNEWVQYTVSFCKKSGGDSYCNANKVASILGIPMESKLRNWENEPLFIGYSYIGHVITEIGRPKYFTHLPAQISQVRFYRTKLTCDENQFIYENPIEIGPKSDELAVWLDFSNIENKGTHITEWRRPAQFKPSYKTEKKCWNFNQLKITAVVPSPAYLEAIVEISDDGELVKDSKNICIENGTRYVDLLDLQQGQYIRIVTKFTAEVGGKGTFIPELSEYQVTASTENDFTEIIWGTRSDWEKGNLIGAIGFESSDRLKTFDEYTDVIHG